MDMKWKINILTLHKCVSESPARASIACCLVHTQYLGERVKKRRREEVLVRRWSEMRRMMKRWSGVKGNWKNTNQDRIAKKLKLNKNQDGRTKTGRRKEGLTLCSRVL